MQFSKKNSTGNHTFFHTFTAFFPNSQNPVTTLPVVERVDIEYYVCNNKNSHFHLCNFIPFLRLLPHWKPLSFYMSGLPRLLVMLAGVTADFPLRKQIIGKYLFFPWFLIHTHYYIFSVQSHKGRVLFVLCHQKYHGRLTHSWTFRWLCLGMNEWMNK